MGSKHTAARRVSLYLTDYFQFLSPISGATLTAVILVCIYSHSNRESTRQQQQTIDSCQGRTRFEVVTNVSMCHSSYLEGCGCCPESWWLLKHHPTGVLARTNQPHRCGEVESRPSRWSSCTASTAAVLLYLLLYSHRNMIQHV